MLTQNYNMRDDTDIHAPSLRRTRRPNSNYIEGPSKLMVQMELIKQLNKPQKKACKDADAVQEDQRSRAQKLPQSLPLKGIKSKFSLSINTESTEASASASKDLKGHYMQSPSEKSVKFVQHLRQNSTKAVSSPPMLMPTGISDQKRLSPKN